MLQPRRYRSFDAATSAAASRRGARASSPVRAPKPPPPSRDPTGTAPLRRAFRNDIEGRLMKLRQLVRASIVDQDALGLAGVSPMGSLASMLGVAIAQVASPIMPMARHSFDPDARKVQAFDVWFTEAAQQTVVDRNGYWIAAYLTRAYERGVEIAKVELGRADIFPDGDRLQSITALAQVELQGAVDAMTHNAGRAMAASLLAKLPRPQINKAISDQIVAIGQVRLRAMANTYIVRAFNEGKLDVYEEVGFRRVGILAETQPPAHRHDHATDADQPKIRKRKPRQRRFKTKPGPEEQTRIERREKRLAALGLVNVQTAEDDDVCFICEDIAEDGPYDIDQARSLIPAHPNCRCSFVPVEEAKDA